jgi:hypothetical protein
MTTFKDPFIEKLAKKTEEGTAPRPERIQNPDVIYTKENYQPTTPAQTPSEVMQNQANYDKLAPWEKSLADKLPGFTQSSIGKALTWFGGTWAGKMLSYLDIPAEGLERASGFVAQAIEARQSPDQWESFTSEINAAWYAGSLAGDMANLPDYVINEQGQGSLVIPTDLPGIRGLVEARKKIASGIPLEQVRDEYYNNQGALSLRAQYQDILFHVVADPLNYVLPFIKPVERIKAAGIALRTFRTSDDFIDLTRQSLAAATTKVDELTEAVRVAKEVGDPAEIKKVTTLLELEEVEKATRAAQLQNIAPLSEMTWRERQIYALTGGDMLAEGAGKTEINFLGKSIGVWNPFGLTPSARAHEYVNVAANGFGNYILARTDDPAEIARMVLDAKNGAMGSQMGHFFMTPEGAAVQGVIEDVNKTTQEMYAAFKLIEDERQQINQFAQALETDIQEVIRLMKETPETLSTRLRNKGMNIEADELANIYKQIDDVPFTKMEWKYELGNKIQDIAAEHAVTRFGVTARGFLEKSALALKSAETLAFLRLNPGYVVRNFWNNEFTMIARGIGGNFTGKNVEDFITEVLRFEPVRYGQAYTMLGEGALADTIIGTTKIEDALRGDVGALDKISQTIKDVNLGKFDMGTAAQKVERFASQRAYLKGYMQGWKRYYWKPDIGFDTIAKYDSTLKGALDEFDNSIAPSIERAVKSAMNEGQLDAGTRKNLNLNIENILDEANLNAGFKIDDYLEPEYLDKIKDGLVESAEQGNVREFMNVVRAELEDHLDELNKTAEGHYYARTMELIKAEGAQGFATILGDVMDEFWGAHDVYADHMRQLSVIDIEDMALRHKFWTRLEKRNSRYWGRQFNRLDEAVKGIRAGADEAGLTVNEAIYRNYETWKKTTQDFFVERRKLQGAFFEARAKGRKPKMEWTDIQARLDKSYENLIVKEDQHLRNMDSMVAEYIPRLYNGVKTRELFLSWRSAVAKLRKADKEAILEFRRSTNTMTRKQIDEAWKLEWSNRMERWNEIRGAERLGYRAMEGDPDAIEGLLMAARRKREEYTKALAAQQKVNDGQVLTPQEEKIRRAFIDENRSVAGIGVQEEAELDFLRTRIDDLETRGRDIGETPLTRLSKVDNLGTTVHGDKYLISKGLSEDDIAQLVDEGILYRDTFGEMPTIRPTEEGQRLVDEIKAGAEDIDPRIEAVNREIYVMYDQGINDAAEYALFRVEAGEARGEYIRFMDEEGYFIERADELAQTEKGITKSPTGRDIDQPAIGEDPEYLGSFDPSTYPDWYKRAQAEGLNKDTMINQLRKMAAGERPDTKSAALLRKLIIEEMLLPGNTDFRLLIGVDPVDAWYQLDDVLMGAAENIYAKPPFNTMSESDVNKVLDWYFTYDIEGQLAAQAEEVATEIRRLDTDVFDSYASLLDREEIEDLGVKLTDFKVAEHGQDIPLSVTEDQYWLNRGHMSLDHIEEATLTQAAKKPLRWDDLPEELTGKVENYLEHVKGQMSDARYASTRFAEFKRDAALLNYNRRLNYNTYLGMIAPYEFWFTQSLGKWALHSLDRPAMLMFYLRTKQFLNTAGATDETLPSRMKGQIRVRLPFVEQMAPWLGEQFIDPMRMALPFDTLFNLPEQFISETRGIDGATNRVIDQMVESGQISPEEALEAQTTQQGDLWENARVTAQSDREGKDAWDFMTLMISPHAPLQWAWEAMSGTPEDIQPFTPLTRFSKAFSGLFGVQDFPFFPHNMEGKVRSMLGLPAFDKWEDYRIDRMLSNMSALNEITADEAEQAMIDREGEIFEEARRKADIEYGLKGTIGFFGMPAQAFPEGERQMRSLADDYNKAHELEDAGSLEAMRIFWDNHPEWGTRLALWKSPEERLNRFLVDEVWSAYNQLPRLNKKEARQQLGEDFVSRFLDKETSSTENIEPETLQLWSRLLSGESPGQLSGQPRSLDLAPRDIAYRANAFTSTRDAYFPNWFDEQSTYYKLEDKKYKKKGEKDARDIYLEETPSLSKYWDWKHDFFHRNPDVVPYLTEEYEFRYQSAEEVERYESTQPNFTWDEWQETLSQPLARLAADAALGDDIPPWVIEDLEEHAENMGFDLATMFDDITSSLENR